MTDCCKWDVLVLTCNTKQFAAAAQTQLDQRKQLGLFPQSLVIFCIADPQDGIGSGGATLNALLIVTEHLSAKSGYTVVSSDVLKNARILLMHCGRYFPYSSCSRGFVSLPLSPDNGESEYLFTNFDALYHTITAQLSKGAPPGLWVCSCDMLLSFPQNFELDWSNMSVGNGVIGISVPATTDYALNHGVFVLDDDFIVRDLIFKGSSDVLSKHSDVNNVVPLVSGVVYFSVFATERLLATHVTPPLDACTYLGTDSGMESVCISLYFDILLAAASDVAESEFVQGNRSGAFGRHGSLTGRRKQFMKHARLVLWKHFKDLKFRVVVIKSGKHCYLDIQKTPLDYCRSLTNFCPSIKGFHLNYQTHSFIDKEAQVCSSTVLINSIVMKGAKVGENSFVVNSVIVSNLTIGSNCYIYGLDEKSSMKLSPGVIRNNSFIMGLFVRCQKSSSRRLFVCLQSNVSVMEKQFYLEQDNEPIEGISTQTKFPKSEVDLAIKNSCMLPFTYRNVLLSSCESKHGNSLLMAKIIPTYNLKFEIDITHSMQLLDQKMENAEGNAWHDYLRSSFSEVLENVDNGREFDHQQSLYFAVACRRINHILSSNLNTSILPFFKMFVICKEHEMVLSLLDSLAVQAVDDDSPGDRRPDVSARAFACIADVFGYMAGSAAGLRSGPAANMHWKKALRLLQHDKIKEGVIKLAEVRQDWLQHPDQLIRAARHYEGAEQILIQHAVKTASSFICSSISTSINDGFWYVAECPVRMDIAGGWTDTPPICYEYGGSVVNVAILLNGKRPVGARICKVHEPVIRLTLVGRNESENQSIVCETLDQLNDYNAPQAPGALLKACIVLSQIVDVDSSISLKEQLLKKFEGGFELQTWSQVPRGSGLGTSSIMAGAILRVVNEANGVSLDQDSLVHAVLIIEQMLTTGGGWQDQVGGVTGGIKIGRSAAKLPLKVTIEPLKVSNQFCDIFSSHLKLVYTGKTRLARNLLQTVIRNWYIKQTEILRTCKELKDTAEQCAISVKAEDLAQIGLHMTSYWDQKKCVASGCEPDLCRRMMDKLRPYSFGLALAGAGGGGFMYVLTKESLSKDFVASLLQNIEGAHDAVVYDVIIDRIGMVCYSKDM